VPSLTNVQCYDLGGRTGGRAVRWHRDSEAVIKSSIIDSDHRPTRAPYVSIDCSTTAVTVRPLTARFIVTTLTLSSSRRDPRQMWPRIKDFSLRTFRLDIFHHTTTTNPNADSSCVCYKNHCTMEHVTAAHPYSSAYVHLALPSVAMASVDDCSVKMFQSVRWLGVGQQPLGAGLDSSDWVWLIEFICQAETQCKDNSDNLVGTYSS